MTLYLPTYIIDCGSSCSSKVEGINYIMLISGSLLSVEAYYVYLVCIELEHISDHTGVVPRWTGLTEECGGLSIVECFTLSRVWRLHR